MPKNNKYNHKPRIIKVDTNNVRFGGSYAAMQRAIKTEKQTTHKPIQEEKQTDSKRREYIESIKNSIKKSHYYWMCIDIDFDDYGLSESEYLEIAEYAIDLYPMQMFRVRYDKISPNNYYEICKVMAKHGVFQHIKYEKLQQANITGVPNAILDIPLMTLDPLLRMENIQMENIYLNEILEVFRIYGKEYYSESTGSEIVTIAENMKKMPVFSKYTKELTAIANVDTLKRFINARDSLLLTMGQAINCMTKK